VAREIEKVLSFGGWRADTWGVSRSAGTSTRAYRKETGTPLVDPGWLFIIAGLGLIAATVIIPAQDDLDEARWMRDRALTFEQERLDRLARHQEYLDALESAEPRLVTSLVASQLNQVPADRFPIPGLTDVSLADASVFPSLEPGTVTPPARVRTDSLLERLTTSDGTRVWMLAGGGLLVLIGLLPAAARRR
jgi:hypothetical protein